MKTLFLCLALLPFSLSAQRRGSPSPARPGSPPSIVVAAPSPIVVPTAGALGGRFLSPGFSRPLGGITPSKTPVTGVRHSSHYVVPVYYVPNAFDTYAYSEAAPVRTAAVSQQPVTINQYFGNAEGQDYSSAEYRTSYSPQSAVQNAGDPIGPQQNYYLIAYKDHSMYSALAYWLEGETLHYVTTQNTHNQASLNLIDLDQTKKLNADQAVPFSLGAASTQN